MFLLKGDRMEESSPAAANCFCRSEIFQVCVDDMGVLICAVEVESDSFDCPLAQHIQLSARTVAVLSAASSYV